MESFLHECLVCPRCKGSLTEMSENRSDDAVIDGALTCRKCEVSYPVRKGIPFFVEKDADDVLKEGIAVDQKNAVALYREKTDPHSMKSGLLFDQELGRADAVMLDIGCGIGKNLTVLRNNGIRSALGFDIVGELVDIARNEFGLDNVFVANANDIPVSDSSIDVCLLYNTIEHCSDPERVLHEVRRILTQKGVLYMDVPNARSMGDRIFRWGGILFYGKTSHIQKFTRKSMERLLELSGFRIVELKTKRGIFIDYPQLKRFGLIRKFFTFFFGNEISCWELKLEKN